MANMIKFYRGLVNSLPATGENGALYITTDEGAIYYGTGTGMKRLGDFVQVDAVANLPAKAHEGCLYYCVAENILAKWNGSTWTQINKQPTAEEMKTLLGLGTMAYKSEVAEGDLNADLKAKVNAAAEGNHSHDNKELLDTYTQTETDLADAVAKKHEHVNADELAKIANGDVAKWNNKVDKVTGSSLVADTEIARLAAMSDGANKVEASETNGNIKVDGEEVVVYTHPEKHAIADVDGLQDALNGLQAKGDYAEAEHDHVVADITDFDEKVNAKLANYNTTETQKAIDDAQDARIKAIEDDYLVEADIANFETKENVKKVADDLAAYEESNDTALALKADKSVVDEMYTNTKIDELVQGAKDYADANDADTKYGITYDSENKKIKLVEGGTEAEIDATDFIKDGMIETVALSEDGLNLVITWNTDSDKGENNVTTIPLTGLVDVYTGVSGDRITVSVSSDDKIGADLVAGSISKNYLDSDVQASLGKADTALQEHQDISHLATTEALNGVDAKFTNYTTTTDLNTALDLKADKTQVATDIATAKGEAISAAETKAAELDAALKTELQAEIDADVKALADGQVKTNTEAIATKANTADVYAKTETYTKTEIEALLTWGSF